MHVRHWQRDLRTRQWRLPDLGAGGLVIDVEHRLTLGTFTGQQECLRREKSSQDPAKKPQSLVGDAGRPFAM